MQMGKKKLALEHLIVKKMEDDDSAGEDIHSILTYGARALFDDSEGASKDVICTSIHDREDSTMIIIFPSRLRCRH